MSPPAICCGTTPSLANDLAGEASDPEFQTLQIPDLADLLAKPATEDASLRISVLNIFNARDYSGLCSFAAVPEG